METEADDFFRPVQQANALCGEGPVWDGRSSSLLWIDLERPAAYRFDPALGRQTANWPVESRIGMIGLATGDRMVIATRELGVAWLHASTGEVTSIVHPARDRGPGFYNDGRVDRRGRLWVGWITDARVNPGMIFRVGPDGSTVAAIDGIHASNGMAWSPDNRTMYFTDSKSGIVYAASFDLASGVVGERRALIRFERDQGIPDGLAVDRDGCLWIAMYQGWQIVKCSAEGKILRKIKTPVLNPTSLCFGGDNLGTLYMTSAVRRHTAPELLAQPLAGALFAAPDPGTTGLPEAIFGG